MDVASFGKAKARGLCDEADIMDAASFWKLKARGLCDEADKMNAANFGKPMRAADTSGPAKWT